MADTREGRLVAAFVALADTLVADYDVVELLQELVETCSELLDATAAGILLTDGSGDLAVIASTSEESRLVELLQLDSNSGPCVEAFRTGKVVAVPDVSDVDSGVSPEFASEALKQGFRAVHAVPLRLRREVVGTLNLFYLEPGALTTENASVAQGLADVATIGILHERAVRESDIARDQLQHALVSRVIIEQAKGVIAQLHGLGMEESFARLRTYARSHNRTLKDVSQSVVDRTLDI